MLHISQVKEFLVLAGLAGKFVMFDFSIRQQSVNRMQNIVYMKTENEGIFTSRTLMSEFSKFECEVELTEAAQTFQFTLRKPCVYSSLVISNLQLKKYE